MSKKKKKLTSESLSEETNVSTSQEENEYLRLNNERLQRELTQKNEELELHRSILLEKDKLIYQLTNENRRLQEQFDLVSSNIVEKDSVVTTLQKLNARIETIEKRNITNPSLTNKLKSLKSIIITPEKQQSDYLTRRDLSRNINLSKLNIKVENVKTLKNGGIELNVEDSCHTKLKEEIKKKLPLQYKLSEPKMFKPRIKIVGYRSNDKITEKEIEEDIIRQNHFVTEEDLHVTYIRYISHKKFYIIYAEISGKLYSHIFDNNNSKILTGFQNLSVYSNNEISQCKNCLKFNHTEKKCTSQKVCIKCGQNHDSMSCNMTTHTCCNCLNSNEKYHKNYNVNHCPTDRTCPVFTFFQTSKTYITNIILKLSIFIFYIYLWMCI
nr:unnamed protein product [Callosobruchus analis]